MPPSNSSLSSSLCITISKATFDSSRVCCLMKKDCMIKVGVYLQYISSGVCAPGEFVHCLVQESVYTASARRIHFKSVNDILLIDVSCSITNKNLYYYPSWSVCTIWSKWECVCSKVRVRVRVPYGSRGSLFPSRSEQVYVRCIV